MTEIFLFVRKSIFTLKKLILKHKEFRNWKVFKDHLRAPKALCSSEHAVKLTPQFNDVQLRHLFQLLHTFVHISKHPRIFTS